jgi:phage-related minor tail protein
MSEEEKRNRAITGLVYTAFEMLMAGHAEEVMPILAPAVRYLLEDAGMVPPTPSALTRLQEEALAYLISNPSPTWE